MEMETAMEVVMEMEMEVAMEMAMAMEMEMEMVMVSSELRFASKWLLTSDCEALRRW